eukprot:SAG11_NODE_1547_length_4713_cov_12.995232_1_plen_201_part_00
MAVNGELGGWGPEPFHQDERCERNGEPRQMAAKQRQLLEKCALEQRRFCRRNAKAGAIVRRALCTASSTYPCLRFIAHNTPWDAIDFVSCRTANCAELTHRLCHPAREPPLKSKQYPVAVCLHHVLQQQPCDDTVGPAVVTSNCRIRVANYKQDALEHRPILSALRHKQRVARRDGGGGGGGPKKTRGPWKVGGGGGGAR